MSYKHQVDGSIPSTPTGIFDSRWARQMQEYIDYHKRESEKINQRIIEWERRRNQEIIIIGSAELLLRSYTDGVFNEN